MATVKNLAELKAVGELKEGDEVVFTVKGEQFPYKVMENWLNYQPEKQGHNQKIFGALGLGQKSAEKSAFVKATQGYEIDTNDFWPEFKSGDFAAATRLVEALYIEIARQEMGAQAPSPAEPTGPRTITTVEELRASLPAISADRDCYFVDLLGMHGHIFQSAEGWCCVPHAGSFPFKALSISDVRAYVEGIVGYAPGYWSWPEVRTAEDLAKVIEDLMIRAGQKAPFTRTPGKPVRVTTVEELEAVAPLQVGDEFVVPAGGENILCQVRPYSNFYVYCPDQRQGYVYEKLGVRPGEFVTEVIGKAARGPGSSSPDVPTLEDMTKLAKALMTHEARAKQPEPTEPAAPEYAEGDVMRSEDGWYRRILDVLDGGKRFFLSDSQPNIRELKEDGAPRFGGVQVTLEELERDYSQVTPKNPISMEKAETEGYVEGALLQDEDGDYRRILAVSSDGKVFAISRWTSDKDDEETLSDPGGAVSLEDLVDEFTVVKPATPVTLTKAQIAEKFGIDVALLRIEDMA